MDPAKIGSFWFSSSSARWEQGKVITLRYEEYHAQGDIQILEIAENRKIVFQWCYAGEANVVTITLTELDNATTIVEVDEGNFDANQEGAINALLDNKEGWVYMLTCLKGYLEYGADLRASLVK